MTRQALRLLLLRAARLLDDAAARNQQKQQRLHTTARELRDAAAKGIRA